MPENEYVVETNGLTKRFGSRTVVKGVDLRVPRGVAFGYLGPNGAGKTTLIRMLLGLTRANGGTMSLRGMPVPERRAEALSRVGAIVEEPRFHGHLNARENLAVVAAARGREAFARIEPAIERVGLAHRAGDRVKTYSMGMRQRLGIARCLLADPDLLILDEPMNGLDPAGILEFRNLLRALVDEGRTVMLSSHILDEVEKTCDQVAIVDQGEIVAMGSLDELRGGGQPRVLIGVDRETDALRLLAGSPEVSGANVEDGVIHVTLADAGAIADVNRRLVEAGIRVHRLEPVHASLEERFLAITSRLEDAE
ncbi:MAG: ABC transporter ATP-binding protein [Gaiellaceae bacterium]